MLRCNMECLASTKGTGIERERWQDKGFDDPPGLAKKRGTDVIARVKKCYAGWPSERFISLTVRQRIGNGMMSDRRVANA
jgi:hypothetical protein